MHLPHEQLLLFRPIMHDSIFHHDPAPAPFDTPYDALIAAYAPWSPDAKKDAFYTVQQRTYHVPRTAYSQHLAYPLHTSAITIAATTQYDDIDAALANEHHRRRFSSFSSTSEPSFAAVASHAGAGSAAGSAPRIKQEGYPAMGTTDAVYPAVHRDLLQQQQLHRQHQEQQQQQQQQLQRQQYHHQHERASIAYDRPRHDSDHLKRGGTPGSDVDRRGVCTSTKPVTHPPPIYAEGSVMSMTFTEENYTRHHSKLQEVYCLMLKFAWWIATLGRSFIIYEKTRKAGRRPTRNDQDSNGLPSDYVSLATVEWERALQYLSTEWKISRLGCALFIPLSVALLQIDAVSQNVLARTLAMGAFIFSIAGLVVSAKFMSSMPLFNRWKCRNEWMKASRSFDDLECVEFWSLLAFPMSLLIWSVALSAMTVLIQAWNMQDGSSLSDGRTRAKTIISASFLMVLAMTLAAFMYRCKQIARKIL